MIIILIKALCFVKLENLHWRQNSLAVPTTLARSILVVHQARVEGGNTSRWNGSRGCSRFRSDRCDLALGPLARSLCPPFLKGYHSVNSKKCLLIERTMKRRRGKNVPRKRGLGRLIKKNLKKKESKKKKEKRKL